MSKMTDPSGDPGVWYKLFEQTPTIIRWAFTVLSFGLFAVAGWAWRMQTRNVERVETQVHRRMDRVEGNLNQRLDEMNKHLIDIAQNTRKQ